MAKFCSECGTALDGAKFCPECGHPAEGAPAQAAPTPADPIPADGTEREVWSGTPDPVLSPVAAKSTKYVITTERIKVESGTLRKRTESLELFRVKDISVKKSMTQRTRGRGDLRITSTDASTPEVKFESVSDPDDVAETLRGLVREDRQRHGVTTQERM
jgi:uncharacterized Zn finger protein (UPF0148 family)